MALSTLEIAMTCAKPCHESIGSIKIEMTQCRRHLGLARQNREGSEGVRFFFAFFAECESENLAERTTLEEEVPHEGAEPRRRNGNVRTSLASYASLLFVEISLFFNLFLILRHIAVDIICRFGKLPAVRTEFPASRSGQRVGWSE